MLIAAGVAPGIPRPEPSYRTAAHNRKNVLTPGAVYRYRTVMTRPYKKWKTGHVQEDRGVHLYISRTKLEEALDTETLDLEKPLVYRTSVGESDGRARVFVDLRHEEDVDMDES